MVSQRRCPGADTIPVSTIRFAVMGMHQVSFLLFLLLLLLLCVCVLVPIPRSRSRCPPFLCLFVQHALTPIRQHSCSFVPTIGDNLIVEDEVPDQSYEESYYDEVYENGADASDEEL